MQVVGYIVAVLATAAGLLGTVMWEGLLLASMPNAKPEVLREIKLWMLGVGVVGVLALAGAAALLWVGRPWWGAGVGLLPAVVVVVAGFIAALQ